MIKKKKIRSILILTMLTFFSIILISKPSASFTVPKDWTNNYNQIGSGRIADWIRQNRSTFFRIFRG